MHLGKKSRQYFIWELPLFKTLMTWPMDTRKAVLDLAEREREWTLERIMRELR